MLNPEFLGTVANPLLQTWQAAEDDILRDICRRMRYSGATETALHQIRMLQLQGLGNPYIEARIRKALGITEKQLATMFDEALRRNLEFDRKLTKMGFLVERDSGLLLRQTELVMEQTLGAFRNITQSLGFALPEGGRLKCAGLTEGYIRELDKAALKIISGTADYNTAIAGAADALAQSGVRRIHYASGHSDQLDVAARRAGLTGVQQLSGKVTEDTARQLGTEIMEITAHAGARPSHKAWQGRLVDKTGRDPRYLTLEAIGYGTVTGFQGANCRHDWYPFLPGISERSYTDEALADIDPPPFSYQGRTYSAYEATQMQRRLERAIRAEKRKLISYEAAGVDAAYQRSAARYRRLQAEYKQFSAAAGLKPQPKRAQAAGFGSAQAARARRKK